MLRHFRSYIREFAVVLIIFALIAFLYSGHNSPSRIVQTYAKTQAIEYISIPDMPAYTAAIVPAEENSGIVCLLLKKEWFWWEVAAVSIPGGLERAGHSSYLTPVGERGSVYATVLNLPPKESQPQLLMVWGETIMDAKTARLRTTEQDLKFETLPAEQSAYFYFFIPHDQYLPVGESLSIELIDGTVILVNHYPFS